MPSEVFLCRNGAQVTKFSIIASSVALFFNVICYIEKIYIPHFIFLNKFDLPMPIQIIF